MVVLRVPPSLDVPVLDAPDDVGLIGHSELQFHLIAALGFQILEQEV